MKFKQIPSKDILYIREQIGCTIQEAKAMALLFAELKMDIYSDEGAATMKMRSFIEKARRYSYYLELKELVKEFGPLED